MITLRRIEFELDEPLIAIRNIKYHIRKKSRIMGFLGWGGFLDNKMPGYINLNNNYFLLNPMIKQWNGYRPSMVNIIGKVIGQHSIKTSLQLSFSGTISTFLTTGLTLLILLLPLKQSEELLTFQFLFSIVTLSNFFLIYQDLNRTEDQLNKLIDLVKTK